MTKEFITYTNWAKIDFDSKNGDNKLALKLEFDDIYSPDDFKTSSKEGSVSPIITMFRTKDKKEAGKLEYNFKEKSYDYFFFGKALSGYLYDALNKYLRAQKYTGDFAVYINTVSSSNLLFNATVKLIDLQ